MNKLWTTVLKILLLLGFPTSVILLTDLNHWKQWKRNKSGKTRENGPLPSIQQKKGGFFGICHLRNTQRRKPDLNVRNMTCLIESKARNKPSTLERPWHTVTRKFTLIPFGFTSKRSWLPRSPEQFIPCAFPWAVDASLQLVKKFFPFSWLLCLIGKRQLLRWKCLAGLKSPSAQNSFCLSFLSKAG